MDYISITNAKQIIDILSIHFGIKSPMVKVHRTIKNHAYAMYGKNTITLSLWSDIFKQENVLLHEFTHILAYQRHGKNGIGHGDYFRLTLIDVILSWYNDIDKYQWNCEYKNIKKWYNRKYNRNV